MNPWKQRYREVVAAAAVVFAVGCGDGTLGLDGTPGAKGDDGFAMLIKSTTLTVGDINCPGGGVQIDSGLDNGDGGGTARDGVLQDGEIDATQRACQDVRGPKVGDFAVPSGAAGTYFINSSGGRAAAPSGAGGNGGFVRVQHDYGTNGGHIKLFKTGQVDASFEVPAVPAASDFGEEPFVVNGIVHVKLAEPVPFIPIPPFPIAPIQTIDGDPLVLGDLIEIYTSCGNVELQRWNGPDKLPDAITGLHVMPGATLVFDAHPCGYHEIDIQMTLRNEGTITAARNGGDSDDLYFYPSNFLGTQGSSIVLLGANSSGGTGGDGGYLYIDVENLNGYAGGFWNFGTFNTSGGSGNDGGDAGGVYVWADNTFINTGAMISRGGDAQGDTSNAGDGGDTELYAGYGMFANSALIDTSGGNGGQYAGDAGYIYLYNDDFGDTRNTGELRALGGTSNGGCGTGCQGGTGGDVYVQAYGDIFNAANVTSAGGDGITGYGGWGGYIEFYSEYDSSLVIDDYNNRGNIRLSGNFDSRGGNGAYQGGEGGDFYAQTDLYGSPYGQEIAFYGYGGGIIANGGDGYLSGGNADYVRFLHNDSGQTDWGDYTPAGAILNYVDITTHGGSAANGTGGHGGYVRAQTAYQKLVGDDFERLVNYGNIDVSGGDGVTAGGGAYYVHMLGLDGLENHGNITARGGKASATSATGGGCTGYAYSSEATHGIALVSDRAPVVNTGSLDNRGGDVSGVTSTGGKSCGILVFGFDTNNSGSLNADGGDSPVADGHGGAGGAITVESFSGVLANTAPSMTAAGGTGTTGFVGVNGVITINGQPL